MSFHKIVFFLLPLILCSNTCVSNSEKNIVFADNVVVAHRGAWKANNLPKNSIASLRKAIDLNCTGSEFDVRMTSDEVLIVTHDADYHGMQVEESTYAELSKVKLPNGETLPTLKDYISAGMKNNDSTGLVCEIKPSKYKERNAILAEKALSIVKELKAESHILCYISFSYEILLKIAELNPSAVTQYLDGSKSPEELKKDGISGLDYIVYKLKQRPEWISSAKENGLLLNAWTANKVEDIDWLIGNDFDYITTDEPELVFQQFMNKAANKESNMGYRLVWSDEFNVSGNVDPEKWAFEKGIIRNNEAQYYQNNAKNVRVENGTLILEAHHEKVRNEAFKNREPKSYKNETEFAEYSSASITTKDLAGWQYGKFEIRAKLPTGRGIWPAIWMLSENWEQVGWPLCGELDIMEFVGYEPDSIFGTIHSKAYNHTIGTEKGKKIFINNPGSEFHIFSMEWTPEKIDFLLDGVVYNHIENEFKTEEEWPFDQNFHLKMNVAVGGALGGKNGIDNSAFPQRMEVDYVRVYQKEFTRSAPIAIGHRGAMGHELENTIPSIQKAIDLKADMLEIDVFVIKSGEVVVFHDETLDRLASLPTKIEDYTWNELKNIEIEGGNKIPLLEDVLNVIDRKLRLNIELKGGATAKPVYAIISNYIQHKNWSASDFLISSFKWEELKIMHQLDTKIPIGILPHDSLEKAIEIGKELQAESINPYFNDLTIELIKDIHDLGMKVYPWTVNEKEDIQRMKDLKVDGIITNFPERVK